MIDKRKSLEKVAFGIAVMFGVYWLYSCFLSELIPIADNIKKIIGLISLYVIGLGMFMVITKKVPTQKFERKKVSFKTYSLCFLLQFTALMIANIFFIILTAVSGTENSQEINSTSLYSLFMLLIFNPIVEEFVFRKLFADKLLKYGEGFYILASSFCFAIVHGVALGVPQIGYTFILGMIWSYLMVKTGDIKVVIVLHSLSNLFGSIVIQMLFGISMAAAGVYSMLLMALGVLGLIIFLVNKKKISTDGKTGLIQINNVIDIFTNRGIIFYALLTLTVMIIK